MPYKCTLDTQCVYYMYKQIVLCTVLMRGKTPQTNACQPFEQIGIGNIGIFHDTQSYTIDLGPINY